MRKFLIALSSASLLVIGIYCFLNKNNIQQGKTMSQINDTIVVNLIVKNLGENTYLIVAEPVEEDGSVVLVDCKLNVSVSRLFDLEKEYAYTTGAIASKIENYDSKNKTFIILQYPNNEEFNYTDLSFYIPGCEDDIELKVGIVTYVD